jgi:hypothetical protein
MDPIPLQSPFLNVVETSLKYEYLDYIESKIFFHFQIQIMMYKTYKIYGKRIFFK